MTQPVEEVATTDLRPQRLPGVAARDVIEAERAVERKNRAALICDEWKGGFECVNAGAFYFVHVGECARVGMQRTLFNALLDLVPNRAL